tara:strand:+ start:513 stop:1193 length:681 start_codon:yes stop_codon:yes gene_type:complete
MKSNHSVEMFEKLAPKYDLMNKVITFGLYKIWQKKLVQELNLKKGSKVLDVATGTGDIAMMLAKGEMEVFASDLSINMLKIAKKRSLKNNLEIKFFEDDASRPKIKNLDAITISFGIRNIPNIKKTVENHINCLNENGFWGCLDVAEPEGKIKRFLFNLWMSIMPFLAPFFKAPKESYFYLKDSVKTFPRINEIKELMNNLGLKVVYSKELFPMGPIILIGQKLKR